METAAEFVLQIGIIHIEIFCHKSKIRTLRELSSYADEQQKEDCTTDYFCLWNEYILFSLENEGVKPNENPHRCPCSTQRFRKDRIRVGRKCFQSGSGDIYTDLSAKRRNGQKSSRKAGHTGRSPQRSGKSVPQRTKETVLKLLQKYGGNRLSEVPPERYAALFADAQEAAHAE